MVAKREARQSQIEKYDERINVIGGQHAIYITRNAAYNSQYI